MSRTPEDPRGAPASTAAELLTRATELMATAEHVLLTCHRHPDGDAVGSLSALAALLRVHGKRFTLYNPDPIPRLLKWLPFGRSFQHTLAPEARYQLTVIVDCGDPKLVGSEILEPARTGPVVVLDHHPVGVPFGDLHVCDPGASSSGVLVARLARLLGWRIDRQAALGLYVSLSSDTGSFRYASTNAEALRLAAELVEAGVDPWDVAERLYERSSMGRYRLLREALGSLERRLDNKVVFMTITHEMVKRAGATWDDSIDLVSFTRAIDGVECGVLLTPAKNGGTRVSMRSKGRAVDAGAICARFGGGGHHGAAGCVLDLDMPTAMSQIESALAACFRPMRPARSERADGQDSEAHDDNSPHGTSSLNRLP